MNKKDLLFILAAFTVWRIFLSVILILSQFILPLGKNFLGGGMENYLNSPQLWAWANFDGEHYLSIARDGYKPLTHFFFPVYPFLMRIISANNSLPHLLMIGILVSHLSFLGALIGLWKLIALDLNHKTAKKAILFVLVFPTSFYFAGVYTESLFLFLCVWSFYFARRKNWLIAGILGAVASATRVVGIILLPALLVEYWITNKPKRAFDIYNLTFVIFLIPLGLLSYMCYLKTTTNDPLIFLHTVNVFGPQRSTHLILLPQVFYRYFFKVLPSLNNYWPVAFTTLLEFITGLLFLILSIYSIFKLRLSYSIFLIGGYIIPTLSGSFSSLPRYITVLFPAFILLSLIVQKLPRSIQLATLALLFTGLVIASSLFFRGYFVS